MSLLLLLPTQIGLGENVSEMAEKGAKQAYDYVQVRPVGTPTCAYTSCLRELLLPFTTTLHTHALPALSSMLMLSNG